MPEISQSWKNAGLAGVAFGVIMGLVLGLMSGSLPPHEPGDLTTVLLLMLGSGVLFGLMLGAFMSSGIVPSAENVQLADGEWIEHTGFANHFLNGEARGGRLVLTNRALVFMPHAANLQTSGLRVEREDIQKFEPVRTLGLVPNGLLVTLKSGQQERLVVNGRSKWLAKLKG